MYKNIYFRSSLFAIWLFFLCLGASANSLKDLDSVLAKSKSLDDFLSRPDLIQEYFEQASIYYSTGKKKGFEINRYHEILSELRLAKENVPELKNRLWRAHSGEHFQIESETTNQYVEDETALSNAQQEIKNLLQVKIKQGRFEKEYLDKNTALEIINIRLNRGSKKTSLEDSEVSKTQESKIEFQSAVASLLNDYLQTEFYNLGQDPKATLLLLDKLRTKQFSIPGLPTSPIITEQIKSMIPTRNVIENKYLRKETDHTARWDFQPVHPFHGIFRGMEVGECMFGKKVSRWGMVAINDNQLYNVEKNGKYRGFVHLIPVQNEHIKGPIYGSIDVGAYDFPKKIKITNQTKSEFQEKIQEETLFDAWYKEAIKRKPSNWAGFVMSDDGDVNNAGARSAATDSSYYKSGKAVGIANEFSTTEPKLEKALYDQDVLLNETRKWYFGEGRHRLNKGLYECSLGGNKSILQLAIHDINKVAEEVCKKIDGSAIVKALK